VARQQPEPRHEEARYVIRAGGRSFTHKNGARNGRVTIVSPGIIAVPGLMAALSRIKNHK